VVVFDESGSRVAREAMDKREKALPK